MKTCLNQILNTIPAFLISRSIKYFFIEIIMIVLSHRYWIKCYTITIFTYFFFSMVSLVILSPRFHNTGEATAWVFSTPMDNVVGGSHLLVSGLKINIGIKHSSVLEILKSILLNVP